MKVTINIPAVILDDENGNRIEITIDQFFEMFKLCMVSLQFDDCLIVPSMEYTI